MRDDRREVEAAKEHLFHLIPGLPHTAAGDTLNGQRIEDDIRPVDLRVRRQDTQLGDVRTFVHMGDHVVEGSRCARHLQTYIEASNTKLLHRTLYGLAFRTVHGQRCAHLLGYLQTKRVDVRYHNMLRAGITTYTRRHRADQTCACNEHIFA